MKFKIIHSTRRIIDELGKSEFDESWTWETHWDPDGLAANPAIFGMKHQTFDSIEECLESAKKAVEINDFVEVRTKDRLSKSLARWMYT